LFFRIEASGVGVDDFSKSVMKFGRNIRIAFKRIDLVNCDAPMDGLVVPF